MRTPVRLGNTILDIVCCVSYVSRKYLNFFREGHVKTASEKPYILFCEWYAKDTSKKVKTAHHAKFAAGERICSYAPLGYKKDSEQKNKLIVDEKSKWIIEKIFDLAVHGAGSAKITKTLIEEHVPTAGWLNYTRYGTFANIYADAPEEKSYAWTITQVKSILKDETYIGNSIHGTATGV